MNSIAATNRQSIEQYQVVNHNDIEAPVFEKEKKAPTTDVKKGAKRDSSGARAASTAQS